MKFIYLFLLLLSQQLVRAQDTTFQKAKNWKLYLIKDRNRMGYRVDTLVNFKYYSLNADSMAIFLRSVTNLGHVSSATWMGSHIVTYELGNVIRKIDVSVYGGFFFDEARQDYFQLPDTKIGEWQDYLSNCMTFLQQNN